MWDDESVEERLARLKKERELRLSKDPEDWRPIRKRIIKGGQVIDATKAYDRAMDRYLKTPKIYVQNDRAEANGGYLWHPACPTGQTYFSSKSKFREFTKAMGCVERGPLTQAEKDKMYNTDEPVLTERDLVDAYDQVERAEVYKNDD